MTDKTLRELIDSAESAVAPVPVGDNLEDALLAAQTPMAALAAAYNHAPHAVLREYINDKVQEILATELPKLQFALSRGPAIPVAEMEPVRTTFDDAMKFAEESGLDLSKMPATIVAIAQELADVIDKGIRRTLLDDTDANRLAYYSLVAEHAKIAACFAELALTEAQQKALDDADAAK